MSLCGVTLFGWNAISNQRNTSTHPDRLFWTVIQTLYYLIRFRINIRGVVCQRSDSDMTAQMHYFVVITMVPGAWWKCYKQI